jgi:hypothetical protein
MMKKQEKKNLEDFEQFLFSLIESSSKRSPLTDQEITRIFGGDELAIDIDDQFNDEILATMKAAHDQRKRIERKVNKPKQINSLGELLNIITRVWGTSADGFARLLGLSPKDYQSHVKDEISPKVLGEHRILTIAAFFNLSINEMIGILDRTIKLMKIRSKTNLAASSARTDKGLSDSTRGDVTLDAMRELLLAIEESDRDENQSSDRDAFKQALRRAAQRDLSPFDRVDTCYTLRQEAARTIIDQLFQQL